MDVNVTRLKVGHYYVNKCLFNCVDVGMIPCLPLVTMNAGLTEN